MSNTSGLEKIFEEKNLLLHGDKERIKMQHDNNKLTAFERVNSLLDKGSFVELYALLSKGDQAAGVITGYGTINSRPIYVFAQDFTVSGGAMGKLQSEKICKLLKTALVAEAPIIAMLDSAGVMLDDGVHAMNAYSKIFSLMSKLSGVCPSIALVCGPCFGGTALLSQLCDISIIVNDIAHLSMYGPQVLSALYEQSLNLNDYASADTVSKQGGVSVVANSEEEAFGYVNKILSLLPDSNNTVVSIEDGADLNQLLPELNIDDGKSLLNSICDAGSYVELYSNHENSIITALGRVGGIASTFVVCNAKANDGLISVGAMNKASRLINFSDCFNLPIISIVNTQGLQIVKPQKQIKLLKAQANLLYAYSEASVPKISLIVGNAIGQAYVAMASHTCNDMVYAWPNAVLSALKPEAAIQVVWQNKIKECNLPSNEVHQAIANEYVERKASALVTAKAGLIDDIIDPKYSRMHIISALEMLFNKSDYSVNKKHGNMPI